MFAIILKVDSFTILSSVGNKEHLLTLLVFKYLLTIYGISDLWISTQVMPFSNGTMP